MLYLKFITSITVVYSSVKMQCAHIFKTFRVLCYFSCLESMKSQVAEMHCINYNGGKGQALLSCGAPSAKPRLKRRSILRFLWFYSAPLIISHAVWFHLGSTHQHKAPNAECNCIADWCNKWL